ncbi:MAG: hypothetical protein ACPG6V_08400 [Flavobacteriales bacterium]
METYNKKQREKKRELKKKMKLEKREQKKDSPKKGPQIDWSLAPENKTLTQEEKASKEANRLNNTKK